MTGEEGVEERDLAVQAKVVENIENQIQEWSVEKKEGILIKKYGDFAKEMNMEKQGKGYRLTCFGIQVLSLDEEGNITYNQAGLAQIKHLMERSPFSYENLGLPDPEYIAYLERQKELRRRGIKR